MHLTVGACARVCWATPNKQNSTTLIIFDADNSAMLVRTDSMKTPLLTMAVAKPSQSLVQFNRGIV